MPTPQTVLDLINGSGNNFHAKVARWLIANGWHTVVSPYYMDNAQSKARELDLIAEKPWPIEGAFGRSEGNVLVRLFVECKFVAADAVFWFAPKDSRAATQLLCSFGGFRKGNTYTSHHHYLAKCPNVAKVFASSTGKLQENDPFYKALNQVLNATVAMRGQPPAHPGLRNNDRQLITLNHPVIVCSSFAQMYSVDFLSEAEPSAIDENFQMEIQYAHLDRDNTPRDEYFLLDFVEFNQLASYQDDVEKGARAAAYLASTR